MHHHMYMSKYFRVTVERFYIISISKRKSSQYVWWFFKQMILFPYWSHIHQTMAYFALQAFSLQNKILLVSKQIFVQFCILISNILNLIYIVVFRLVLFDFKIRIENNNSQFCHDKCCWCCWTKSTWYLFDLSNYDPIYLKYNMPHKIEYRFIK